MTCPPPPSPYTELCVSTEAFSKSAATLGNVEENDTVSRALARLAEVEEKVEALHEEQVGNGLAKITFVMLSWCLLYQMCSLTLTFSCLEKQ